METLSFILALAAVICSTIIGALGLWLTHKAQISSTAHKLYETKIEAYKAVMPIATQFSAMCVGFFRTKGVVTDANLKEFRAATAEGYEKLNIVYRLWSLFLPSDVSFGVIALLNAYSFIAKDPMAKLVDAHGHDIESPGDEELINQVYFDLANTIRKDLGVDALSDETRRLIGKVTGSSEFIVTLQNSRGGPPAV